MQPEEIVAQLDRSTHAYYAALGGGAYRPTVHVQGAWNAHEQHMAPVAGLLVHAITRHEPRQGMQIGRVTFEILGLIPALESVVRVETIRPGRTIELVEATMAVGGRDVIRARAWRLATQDTAAVAGDELERLPSPGSLPVWGGMSVWGGGFIDSLEFKAVDGHGPGRGRAWLRTQVPLVDGEPVAPVAAFLGLVDTANGIGPRLSPAEWMFPNVDLTVHLFRQPRPGWVGLDGRVAWGPSGLGLTSSTLHDEDGPVGRVEQCLTVRPMPPA